MILTLRTDNPTAEVGLFSNAGKELGYKSWSAHRELSNTILKVIEELLKSQPASMDEISGVVFYEGPGSFTGLRIGAAVANALEVPVVNVTGENWVLEGLDRLKNGTADPLALPHYGAEPHITSQKK